MRNGSTLATSVTIIMLAIMLILTAAPAHDGPPAAKVVPHVFEAHGTRRVDDYFWLRNRDDPEVRAYIEAENAYAEARLAPLERLIGDLSAELLDRVDDLDADVPYTDNGYVYERRFAEGAEYPVIIRRNNTPGAPEEVVLDVPALAAGHDYYNMANYAVSHDGGKIAFAVDFSGARLFRIFVRDLVTGTVTDLGIDKVASDLVFAADGRTLFYLRQELDTLRGHQVWRRDIGGNTPDALVYEERDPTFDINLSLSRSGKFVLIHSEQHDATEVRYLAADQPLGPLHLMEPRRAGLRYYADHVGDTFYIRTNRDAPDYQLVMASEEAPGAENWKPLVPEAPGQHLRGFEVFDNHIAITLEHDAIQTLRLFRRQDMKEIAVPRPAELGFTTTFVLGGAANRDPSSSVLRLRFAGPLHPPTLYEFDMTSGALVARKQSKAAAWFKPELYETQRLLATAPDGEKVPVTVVYRKEMRRPSGNPLLLEAYGAYGISFPPTFPGQWLSLIDRGFMYAIAHVRGGREKGQQWHEHGRVLTKRNSFTDFVAATEELIRQGYADPQGVFANGRSAGGLLVGAVANMRPDLYAGIVAEVPFVDVIGTMTDPTIPLTTLEYGEWGDPAIPEQYRAMLAYSPYDNVARKNYPPMFLTAGWSDSQVGFHEPAKWVARLRATKTDNNEILFKTNMGAGHNGDSGRFGSVQERAEVMAWLLAEATRTR